MFQVRKRSDDGPAADSRALVVVAVVAEVAEVAEDFSSGNCSARDCRAPSVPKAPTNILSIERST